MRWVNIFCASAVPGGLGRGEAEGPDQPGIRPGSLLAQALPPPSEWPFGPTCVSVSFSVKRGGTADLLDVPESYQGRPSSALPRGLAAKWWASWVVYGSAPGGLTPWVAAPCCARSCCSLLALDSQVFNHFYLKKWRRLLCFSPLLPFSSS